MKKQILTVCAFVALSFGFSNNSYGQWTTSVNPGDIETDPTVNDVVIPNNLLLGTTTQTARCR